MPVLPDESELNLASLQHISGVCWRRFLPAAVGVLALAGLLATALHLLFLRGWYIIMLAAAVAALILAAGVYLAVQLGHCRNRLIAVLLGVIAGLVTYLGQYHIDMIQKAGPAAAFRLDRLPRYIAKRKSLEVQQKLGPAPRGGARVVPANGNQPANVDTVGNWLFFGLELTFVVVSGATVGAFAAGRPYCDRCGKWMRRTVWFLPPGAGPTVLDALAANRLADLVTLPSLPPPQNGSYTAVVASWCEPKAGDAAHGPVFLSVKAVRRGGGPTQFSQVDAVLGRRVLWMRPLSAQQVSELLPRFPALNAIVRRWEQLKKQHQREVETPPSGAVALVQPIVSIDSGTILSKKAMLIGNLLSLIPLLMFAAAVFIAALGYLAFGVGSSTGLALLAGGAALAILALGIIVADIGWLSRRYLLRRARAAIELRSDAIVRPNDPEALFVQVVPRERWGKLGLDTASDVGFIKIDSKHRQVLFEGDRQRYSIPAEAIESCEVEKIVYGTGGQHETCIFVSVLRARSREGIFEAPLGQRADLKQATIPRRRAWAEDFSRRIMRLSHPASPP